MPWWPWTSSPCRRRWREGIQPSVVPTHLDSIPQGSRETYVSWSGNHLERSHYNGERGGPSPGSEPLMESAKGAGHPRSRGRGQPYTPGWTHENIGEEFAPPDAWDASREMLPNRSDGPRQGMLNRLGATQWIMGWVGLGRKRKPAAIVTSGIARRVFEPVPIVVSL